MVNLKRFLLAIVVITACWPVVGLLTPIPVYATTMANETVSSNFSIRYNPTTLVWSQGADNYVGCVNRDNDTQYGIGLRFTTIAIPHGATIDSAHLIVTSSGNYSQHAVSSFITGEDVDSAAVFVNVADYKTRRGTIVDGATDNFITSASIAWTGIDDWVAGTQYRSPDISDIIEEIVNRTGWATGNDMVLFWDDHGASSSQVTYSPAVIRAGSSYVLEVDYTALSSVTGAVVSTKTATDIGSTSAVLNGYIESDGDDTDGVMIRFGYDNISHAFDFSLYTNIVAWSTSNYSTGDAPLLALTSLNPGNTYFFNIQGVNSVANYTSSEMSFVTPAVLVALAPSNFVIIPSSSTMSLQWSKPSGFSTSIVRYSQGSIPSSNTSGTLLYQGTNSYCTQTGLTAGATYGYRVWGYEDGTWSTSSTGMMTTSGASSTTGLETPVMPFHWFWDTDYRTMNQTFFYPIVNNLADSFAMPRDTAWMTWALALSMFLGFIVWATSRSMVALTVGVILGVVIGWAQHLVPLYMAFLVLVFGISIIAMRERV